MSKTVTICMGSSCFCRGNEENLKIIEEYIEEKGIGAEVKLIGKRCEQLCDKGPVIYIDDTLYTQVDKTKLLDILNKDLGINES